MRLLIVDDEYELVETLVERLEIRGIDAVGSTDGQEALAELESGWFDVVLVDVRMPGMDGLELMQAIHARNPRQPVVMLTGHGSSRHAEDGLRLGAAAYLMKPVKLEVLLGLLDRLCQEGRTES